MRMKLRTTTVAVVALMLGMVAGTAWAQESPEVADAEECLLAVLVSGANFLPEDEFPAPETDEFGAIVNPDGYFESNPGIVDDFLDFLDELDVDVADICELGGTYVPDVLGVVFEQPDNGTPDDDEIAAVVAQPVDPPSAEVLGVQLARTGLDAAIIALIGVALLGLGVVAVRGTRGRVDEA